MSEEFREEFAGPESSQKAIKLKCVREGWVIEVREKRKLLDDCRSPRVVKKVIKHGVFVKATNSKGLQVVNKDRKIQRVRDFRATRMSTRTQNRAKRTPSERRINFTPTLDENLRSC